MTDSEFLFGVLSLLWKVGCETAVVCHFFVPVIFLARCHGLASNVRRYEAIRVPRICADRVW